MRFRSLLLTFTIIGISALVLAGCLGPGMVGRADYTDGAFHHPPCDLSAYGDVMPNQQVADEQGRDRFASVKDNPWLSTTTPGGDASTFAIDVDTASYSTTRAWLRQQRLPAQDSVRVEEMLNYFSYAYQRPQLDDEHPVVIDAVISACPWNQEHRLARVTVASADLPMSERPSSNLVFLIDVSGSMANIHKLGLIKQALSRMVTRLDARDRVAVVVYAGAAGVVLESTPGNAHAVIMASLERLHAGGSTAGAAGIRQAYGIARKNLIPGGNNRVILATDGDFNVGVTDRSALVDLIKRESDGGIDLTVVGVGMGNYHDHLIEEITNQGNGTYHYLDSLSEARKVFGNDLTGSLITVAREVKAQLFFNPAVVSHWRQIGYANRQLERDDFDDDTVDGGEVGAGHTVTALYEIKPTASAAATLGTNDNPFIDRSKVVVNDSEASLRLRLRYQPVEGGASRLQQIDVIDAGTPYAETDDDFRWAATVAAWGMLLRGGRAIPGYSWNDLGELASEYRGRDPFGYRAEAKQLMRLSWDLAQLVQ